MDEVSKEFLEKLHIDTQHLDGQLILRDTLLNDMLYDDLFPRIKELKSVFSSSYMTSLQVSAKQNQKWPLLNLVRQILHTYQYNMKPIRKSDGYTPEGVKKFKRYFIIKSKAPTKTVVVDEQCM